MLRNMGGHHLDHSSKNFSDLPSITQQASGKAGFESGSLGLQPPLPQTFCISSSFNPINLLEKEQHNGWHFGLLKNRDEKKNNKGHLVESYEMIKGFEYMINRLLRPMDLTPY